ncbi:MAG: hypothetical protein ACI9F2_000511, partial [Lysobacterales bacterium]
MMKILITYIMILGSVVLVSTGVFAETTYSLKKMTP